MTSSSEQPATAPQQPLMDSQSKPDAHSVVVSKSLEATVSSAVSESSAVSGSAAVAESAQEPCRNKPSQNKPYEEKISGEKQLPPAQNLSRSAVRGAGIVVVDKPANVTSHDVVAVIRRAFHTRRVGHAGTLDPMATGVIVLGIERATKLLGLLQMESKSYHATIRLGARTLTDDREGEVLSTSDTRNISDDDIAGAIIPLTGDISQVPSSVSAIKVDGKRAYQRIRNGESIQLEARPVTVSRFDIMGIQRVALPGGLTAIDIDVEVDCSSGTYIRALARDLGGALKVGGHLTALRRTRVGPFGLEETHTLDELVEQPALAMTLDEVSQYAFPVREVSAVEALGLSQGKWLEPVGIEGFYTVVDPKRQSIAVVRESSDRASSVFVIRPSTMS